jgi:hypothetical protein
MSSQLTSLVTVFDSQNYGNWSKAMRAFLMAQGLWSYTDGTSSEPFLPINPTPIPPLPSSPAPSQKDADAHKNKLFVHFKPLIIGQTLYWLDALTTTVEAQFIETIYKVDYYLMHRHFGHPSKEVLRQAKDQTKGFPEGISIPTNTKVCPGCVQGKMPAAVHPPSKTWAAEAFKWIHSDLKSFPDPSYHKYKYFIVFLDDYTSFVLQLVGCSVRRGQ